MAALPPASPVREAVREVDLVVLVLMTEVMQSPVQPELALEVVEVKMKPEPAAGLQPDSHLYW